MLLSVSKLPGSDDSPVLVEQTTGFLQADNSALIDLAQTDLLETANVGAGEPSAQSTLFYASPNGNGNGTQGNPWSLAQANSQLRAGDTLYLTAGMYFGSIEPTANGNSNNPIRITVVPGLNPDEVHVSHSDEGSIGSTRKPTVKIRKDFIIVDGFTVSFKNGLKKNQAFASNVDVTGDHVTIRNMRIIHDATEADGPLTQGQLGEHVRQARLSNNTKELGVSVNGSFGLYENNLIQDMWLGMAVNTKVGHSHNVIRGNTVADSIIDGIRMGKSDGTPLSYLIENNIVFGSHLSHGITLEGVTNPVTKVIIRNNAIFNNAELGIALKGSKEIVIEGNFFWGMIGDTDGSGVLVGNGAQTALENSEGTSGTISTASASFPDENVIIRNNVAIDSNQGTIAQKHFKVYSNTFLNNRRNFTGSNQPTTPLSGNRPADSGIKAGNIGPNAAILNNVFGDHGYEITLRPGTNATVDGNTYYNTFQTPRFAEYGGNGAGNWSSHTLSSWQAWLQTRPAIQGNEAHSQVVSDGPAALFVNVPGQVTGDPAQFDFTLKSNSQAKDAGVFLTKTSGSGSNKTTMTVGDAKMFFDGYGITLGDEIQLAGQTARARITNISGNTLTLDSPLSWTSGTGVSLSYEGSSPDAGAIEFTSTPGDFDADGDTDGADFLNWQRGFGTTYDADDLTDWEDNFGASGSSVASMAAAVTALPTLNKSDVVEFSANDAGVVLRLDLQTSTAQQPLEQEIIDKAFAYLAEPSSVSQRTLLFGQKIATSPPLAQEQIEEDSKDKAFVDFFDLAFPWL